MLSIPTALRLYHWLLSALALGIALLTLYQLSQPTPTKPAYSMQASAPDTDANTMQAFAEFLRESFNAPDEPTADPQWEALLRYPIHVELWRDGHVIAQAASSGNAPDVALRQLKRAYESTRTNPFQPLHADTMLLLTFFYQPQPLDMLSGEFAPLVNERINPQTDGIFIRCRYALRFAPPHQWQRNQLPFNSTAAYIRHLLQQENCTLRELEHTDAEIHKLTVNQWLQEHAKAPIRQP